MMYGMDKPKKKAKPASDKKKDKPANGYKTKRKGY
jgi:hypothetical protein